MRADAGLESHRVAHEAADAAVPIQEGMDVVEPVMRGGHRQDALAHAERREAVSPLEMLHESFDTLARRREVPSYRYLVICRRAEFPRHHAELRSVAADEQHGFGRVFVEGAMQPADEDGRRRFGQAAGGVAPVDLALKPDVRPRLHLKVATLAGCVDLIGQRALNLARRRVMPFDQVGIVAVHDPHGFGQAGGGTRVQPRPERTGCGRQRRHQVDDLRAGFVQQARFDPCWGFFRG